MDNAAHTRDASAAPRRPTGARGLPVGKLLISAVALLACR